MKLTRIAIHVNFLRDNFMGALISMTLISGIFLYKRYWTLVVSVDITDLISSALDPYKDCLGPYFSFI